jgi:hypothetical protein
MLTLTSTNPRDLSDIHLIEALRSVTPPDAHLLLAELQRRLHNRQMEIIKWKRLASTNPLHRRA